MTILNHYLSMLVFATGLLLGVQLPNWVNQYVQRIDAHFLEAQLNITPYQKLADEMFNGSIAALIERHQQSQEKLFQREAAPIQQQFERFNYLKQQRQLLSQSLWQQLWQLAKHIDHDIARETIAKYQATIPLHQAAILCGLIGGVLASILYEILRNLLSFKWLRRRKIAA
ncbi:DUF2937 family protein [Alteromonadaceae bacterium BrNp21-10]|nr:DUF2937 family protein [Alteromonadaceae bacterium BrNp21-10]